MGGTPTSGTEDGIRLTGGTGTLCANTVLVCGRKLNPLGTEIGGHFTVRINRTFRSTYECAIMGGRPVWVPTSSEGTCEEVPVIMLPAKYDEAWNVG